MSLAAAVSCASPPAMQPASPKLDAPSAASATSEDAGAAAAAREVGARHILIRVGEFPSGKSHTLGDAHRLIDELRARVEAGEDFAALAKQSSEDPGSARRGGDLGSFGRGKMVQSFEDAVFALPVGGYAVVETVFGVHLVQRTK